jgi:UDP-3-O-[3-hydroxymyristoyl] glucosamine N-acyltransferase
MADSRFYQRQGPFTLAFLAEYVKGALSDRSAGETVIVDIAAPQNAPVGSLVYCEDKRYIRDVQASSASGVIMRDSEHEAFTSIPGILVKSPSLAFAEIADLFYPPMLSPMIDAAAAIDPSAVIGQGVHIGCGVVIGARAEIGDGCRIDANSVIGDGCILGVDCWISPNVTIECAVLGARVRVKPGARLGQTGFGFIPGTRGLRRMPQVGRLLIGDDVEVGANSCIDRGALNDTVIGAGTKIDNLVQIGHNTVVGRHCVIVAQVGLSGSSTLGDNVMMGGQSASAGHISIGSGAKVSAQAGVMRDIEPGAVVGGSPSIPIRQFHKQSAWLAKQVTRKE